MFWCVRCTLIGVISLAIAKNVGASWQVDHAFGDNAFTSAGTLIESVKGLQLTRSLVSSSDNAQLKQLVDGGGFYRIRITGAESRPVQASVPARCLLSGEKLLAVMTASGNLVGLSYDLSEASCDPSSSSPAPAQVTLASSVPVSVITPARASTLRQQPKPLDGSKPGARSTPAAAQKPSAAQGQVKREKGADGAEEEVEKPPDTRSWIQKNWIFIIPALLMLVNGFGGAQQRARAPAGPAVQQPRARQSR